eukprot:699626-Pyramimonas_sp.AAC.1
MVVMMDLNNLNSSDTSTLLKTPIEQMFRVSHAPIRHRKWRYILTKDQSDAGNITGGVEFSSGERSY